MPGLGLAQREARVVIARRAELRLAGRYAIARAVDEREVLACRGAVFRQAVRVYWEDTDAGGIVFYANYLKFFERARTEWLRAKGYSQERLRTEQSTAFIVTDAAVSYR